MLFDIEGQFHPARYIFLGKLHRFGWFEIGFHSFVAVVLEVYKAAPGIHTPGVVVDGIEGIGSGKVEHWESRILVGTVD